GRPSAAQVPDNLPTCEPGPVRGDPHLDHESRRWALGSPAGSGWGGRIVALSALKRGGGKWLRNERQQAGAWYRSQTGAWDTRNSRAGRVHAQGIPRATISDGRLP